MGKATRWFKGLLGMKKEKESPENSSSVDRKDKKRWSFAKSSSKIPLNIPVDTPATTEAGWLRSYISESEKEQNKHAIAVAAATAAAADAAVAAAQAAVAVVRLTSQNRGNRGTLFCCGNEKWAAIKVQAVFRGYLARKALRALKGLVKIQALVRGYLVRKRAAATLHSMQALIRAQASVRSQRALRLLNKSNRFAPNNRARRSMERFDETRSEFHSKRLSVENGLNAYEEGSPKIVEVDTYSRPRSRSRRISDSGEDPYYYYQNVSSSFPCPVPTRISVPDCRNLHHYEWSFTGDEFKCCTAQSTPRFANSTNRSSNAPVTPAKSVCGDGYFRAYSNDCPNYMSNTQSFRAKVRSQSAPKQRAEPGSKKRLSLNEIMESRASLSGVRMQRSCTQVQEDLEF